jgi:hypothetical protein
MAEVMDTYVAAWFYGPFAKSFCRTIPCSISLQHRSPTGPEPGGFRDGHAAHVATRLCKLGLTYEISATFDGSVVMSLTAHLYR